MGQSCDDNGHCTCKSNFMGIKCDKCAPNRFNPPLCEECNCDPKGVADNFFQRGGCATARPGELCTCKEKVTGRTCNQCKPLYWDLQKWRTDGCEACDCFRPGTIGGIGVCDLTSGQCVCKPAVGGSRKCDACKEGFFRLAGHNMLGCDSCDCDLGGTAHVAGETPGCKEDGQCSCRYGMISRTCNEIQPGHYLPTLFQHKFEIEDGYRLDGSNVRFAYDQAKFPGFSWRGYAAYSPLQTEVLQDISLTESSLYQMVLRYQNPNSVPITGTVRMSKADGTIVHKFSLDPTSGDPALMTVSGETGVYPSPFDLEPGRWTVSVSLDNDDSDNQEVLVDYFVLLPAEYTEPRILKYDITTPCLRDGSQDFCRDYIYPRADKFPNVDSTKAMNPTGADPYEFRGEPDDLENVGTDHVVQIINYQPEIKWVDVPNNGGAHVIVLDFFTPVPTNGSSLDVSTGKGSPGEAFIYDCPYKQLCRQVVTDAEGRVAQYRLDPRDTNIYIRSLAEDTNVAIDKVYLIPVADWSPDFITPFPKCVKDKMGKCRLPKPFPVATDGSAILLADGALEPAPENVYDPELLLAKLGGESGETQLVGKVPFEGAYILVAQYYQPNHPAMEAKAVVQDGHTTRPTGGDQMPADMFNVYEAVLPLPNCASAMGCRQPVVNAENPQTPAEFKLTETVDVKFELSGPDNAWIEYVLAVPTNEYDEKMLESDESIDRRGEFIQQCGQNSFYVPTNVDEGFCKAAVVSVAADFNNGAFKCNCDAEGANAKHRCEAFGGQCECKPNVIGRACSRCAPGFYGFPDCKACNCPVTATCNEETGECICAPHVTGTDEAPCSGKVDLFRPQAIPLNGVQNGGFDH